jgi:site-specific DNA recombinase
MKKVADCYVRVSTEEQANSGYSQRYQDEMLRKYCEINDIQIRKIIYEDHSAKNFDRPAFKKLLAEYKKQKGLVDRMLFLKWDRFSRNAGDSYAMLTTLNKLGIDAQAIEQPLDLSIPENKLMLAFFLAAPEVENARRAINVKTGMRRACKEGRHMGPAPVGYCNKVYENGRKYIEPKEDIAEIIRWAFNELAKGAWSVLELWKQARKKGLPCSKNTFWSMINNPVYCGKIYVPKDQHEESCYVQGTHKPIVSEELFYTVQDVLHGRKRTVVVKQPIREEFPLRNFLVCTRCGKLVSASSSKGRSSYYSYYHCHSSCGWRYKAEQVNEAFVQELRNFKPRPGMVTLYKEVILDVFNHSQSDGKQEKKQLMAELTEQNKRLTKARELLLVEAIDAADYKEIKTECERKTSLLEAKLASVAPQQENLDLIIEKALNNLANIDERYQQADVNGKRQIIGSMFLEKLQFEDGVFRTAKVNEAVSLIYSIDKALDGIKKGQTSNKADLSSLVVRPGFEPRQTVPKTVVLPLHHRTIPFGLANLHPVS